MKTFFRKCRYALVTALLVASNPFGVFNNSEIIKAQTSRQLPARIQAGETPADITVAEGSSRVVGTGDVNGDGIDDILIGSPTYYGEPAPPPWFTGNVRIVLGSRSIRGTIDQADVFISGLPVPRLFRPVSQTTLGDHLGESLEVADINGDGISDILIGAPGATSDKKGRVEYLSRAHAILGSTEIRSGTGFEIARDQQDITVSFDSKTSGGGSRVGSGDFNGDGVSDILVGSHGAVHVFFGGGLRPPQISKAKYRKSSSELSIFGTDFTGSAHVEINGVVFDGQITFDLDENKLVLEGKKSDLNLKKGKNEVVVIRRGLRSNTIKLNVK
jgi:hypothetical protein